MKRLLVKMLASWMKYLLSMDTIYSGVKNQVHTPINNFGEENDYS